MIPRSSRAFRVPEAAWQRSSSYYAAGVSTSGRHFLPGHRQPELNPTPLEEQAATARGSLQRMLPAHTAHLCSTPYFTVARIPDCEHEEIEVEHFVAEHNGYTISTDPVRLDFVAVHAYLTRSYWAAGIPMETVRRSAAHSLCFGVYQGADQIGFARVITDHTTFGYLADVYVLEEHRGRGVGKWLVETILAHPDIQGLRRLMLSTRDAAGLYTRYGFQPR